MKLRHLLALLCFLPAATFAADFEFDGVIVEGNTTKVALLNITTGKADWVAVKGKFDGYIVTSYTADAKIGDSVVLTKEGSTLTVRLTLKNSSILPAAPASVVTPAQQKAVTNNLRQLSAGADQYFLEKGVTTVTFDQIVGTTAEKYVKPLTPAAGENYSGMVFKQGQPVKVAMPDGTTISYGP